MFWFKWGFFSGKDDNNCFGSKKKKHRHCKDNKTIYQLAQTRSIAEEDRFLF